MDKEILNKLVNRKEVVKKKIGATKQVVYIVEGIRFDNLKEALDYASK